MEILRRVISRGGLAELLFWATRLGILFLLPMFTSDIGLYRSYANAVLEGHKWVYRDISFEYPPLAFVPIFLPGAVLHLLRISTDANFRVLFGLLLLPFDHWIYNAHRRQDPSCGRAFLYIALGAMLPHLLYDRLDLLVGFALAFPFLSGPEAGVYVPLRAAVAWGLGGAYKIVPLVALPAALTERGLPRATRALLGAAAALPLAAGVGLALVLGHGSVSFFTHHAGRGVQIESLYASVVIFAKAWLGLFPGVFSRITFGAHHLEGMEGIRLVAKGGFLAAMGLTFPAVIQARRRGRLGAAGAAWILVLTLVLFSYVLSPQFLFWLVPLAPALPGELRQPWRGPWIAVFCLSVLLTGIHFRLYWSYEAMEPWPVLGLFLRNLLLMVLLGLSWAGFWRPAAPILPAPPLDYSPPSA